MAMSKKDYELIAATLSKVVDMVETPGASVAAWEAVSALADAFADDNPRFNRQKFIDAVKEVSL